ncbi:hypothetical protein CW704_01745 [Candidatus Bathyarchaeota archaeon]|nr:MAG: hypothetical protein CW704_01745 [Candidatus Bathyarchaeota archaeon]
MNGKTTIYVSLLIGILAVSIIVGIALLRVPQAPAEEQREESPQPSKTSEEEQSNQTVVSVVPVTLEDYDWSKGAPSWEVLNNTAENLTRIEIDFLKGAISAGLFDPGPFRPVNETAIEENLLMKQRLNATVYAARFMLVYRDGEFYTLGSETRDIDRYLRAVMADCIMAKKAGLAVHLSASFFSESGFKSVDELRKALDDWQTIVGRLAGLSERYKFEFFNPFGELDHFLRVDCRLKMSEEDIIKLVNEYHSKYASTVRSVFKGKLVTQLGDAHPIFRDSLYAYNLSCVDLVGILVGSKISLFDEERFGNDLLETAGIMRELCQRWNNSWYISEVWFYDDKPATEEKLKRQSECFESLFKVIRHLDPSVYRGPVGVLIMNWNLREDKIFADIINRPAESTIKEFFSSPIWRAPSEETVLKYPSAEVTWLPDDVWADMGVAGDADRIAYMASATIDEVSEWYKQKMAEWTLIDEDFFSDENQNFSLRYLLLKKDDQGVYIFVMKDPHVPAGKIVIGIASGPWELLKECQPMMMSETAPKEGEGAFFQVEPPFTHLPELGEGSVVFTVSPVELEAIGRVEPLGRMNAPSGHVIPTEHGGFILKNPALEYQLRAPADGIIFEIMYKPEFDDYQLRMAHSNTFVSIFDHLTGLSEEVEQGLQEGEKTGENSWRVKIYVKAGDVIGKVGGHPDLVVGFDWGVYDKDVNNSFINPERYNLKYICGTHFIPYCEESLKEQYLAKLPRTAEPRIGTFCYDQPGKLVGNWILEEFAEENPDVSWKATLAFAYDYLDPSKVLIGIGGYLVEEPATYVIHGNTPDPADVDPSSGKIVYYLEPYDTNPDAPKITLLVQMVSDDRIKVEAFKGWISSPEFTENAYYYTR